MLRSRSFYALFRCLVLCGLKNNALEEDFVRLTFSRSSFILYPFSVSLLINSPTKETKTVLISVKSFRFLLLNISTMRLVPRKVITRHCVRIGWPNSASL